MNAAARPRFWRTVFWYTSWGPLIGGLPYVWTIIGLPVAYVLGLGPATICGALVTLWLRAGPLPGVWHAAAFGGLFGAAGAFGTQMIVVMVNARSLHIPNAAQAAFWSTDWFPLGFIAPHAVVAGIVMTAYLVHKLKRPTPKPQQTAALPAPA